VGKELKSNLMVSEWLGRYGEAADRQTDSLRNLTHIHIHIHTNTAACIQHTAACIQHTAACIHTNTDAFKNTQFYTFTHGGGAKFSFYWKRKHVRFANRKKLGSGDSF